MSKALGEQAELQFYVKSYELGFIVSKPFGDNASYDFIVDWGGKLSRIQVKSTAIKQIKRCDKYRISLCRGHDRRTYAVGEIDFVVAFIHGEKTWYVIPNAKTQGRKTLGLYPHRSALRFSNCGAFEKYKELWSQLQ